MSVQEKKTLAYRVFDEIWSQGNLDLTEELLSPDFVGRPGGLGEPFRGPAGAREFIGRLREGFPDIRFTVEDMAAEGDLVATRWMSVGTHEGEFMGLEPTGRQASFGGMTFLRFENGAIVEGWTQIDALSLLRAIGAVREPVRA
ncbi:MAG TPA: ester cyclase [Gaiellaceae bacterium]|nr:ester cyclase [Gaiellaceae bacterium]